MLVHSHVVAWDPHFELIAITTVIVDAIWAQDALQTDLIAIKHHHARLKCGVKHATNYQRRVTVLSLIDLIDAEVSLEQQHTDLEDIILQASLLNIHAHMREVPRIDQF